MDHTEYLADNKEIFFRRNTFPIWILVIRQQYPFCRHKHAQKKPVAPYIAEIYLTTGFDFFILPGECVSQLPYLTSAAAPAPPIPIPDTLDVRQLRRSALQWHDSYPFAQRPAHELMYKFSQNTELKKQLLATEDKVLVEGTASDKVFANGQKRNDPDRFDMSKWTGQNLLGFALMEVRKELSS